MFVRNQTKVEAMAVKSDLEHKVAPSPHSYCRSAAQHSRLVPHSIDALCFADTRLQDAASGRRMSVRVQLSHAIKDTFHGAAAPNSAQSNLLRRASLAPIGELSAFVGDDVDGDSGALLPLIKRCVFVSEVRICCVVLKRVEKGL
jgi:hypothetical protein